MSQETEYVLSKALEEAILVCKVTGRPLLVKGEPGTGKSLLAEYIANTMNVPLFRWHVKSTTVAQSGLYHYDALSRLNDARFSEFSTEGGRDPRDPSQYIRLEGMGQAFAHEGESVLLIDEIDKADIEFPNDLLLELDRCEFLIEETGEWVRAQHRPFVVITSNNEKELPDAFLRRCIFHYIEFPDAEFMTEIVKVHFPEIQRELLESSLRVFYQLREQNLLKHPSTSELIDWLQILSHQGLSKITDHIKDAPFLGTLLKNEEDYFQIQRKASRRTLI